MLLHCLTLLFVNILRLFVAVIPLHNKMCCQALNVLMELREGSGAEGVVSKYSWSGRKLSSQKCHWRNHKDLYEIQSFTAPV